MTLSGAKIKKEDSALSLRIIKYNFKENCTHLPFSFATVQSSDLRYSIPPILCSCLIYLLQTPKTKQSVTCSKLAMFSIRSQSSNDGYKKTKFSCALLSCNHCSDSHPFAFFTIAYFRSVFKTTSNIYDGAFWENN